MRTHPSPYYKLGTMLAWHRQFHGEFPKTVCITHQFSKLLYEERPELKRKRSILGAKIVVMPDTLQGKTATYFIVDELDGDLDVRSPWSP